jgi:hypothetical protein
MTTFTLSKEVSDEQFNRIISIESAGDPDAVPPKGSAGGLGQFLNDTWDDTGQKHYPALKKKFGAGWRALRKGKKTATLQLLMLARFTEDNVRGLGKGWQNGDLYLAHFLGLGDARKVFHAVPSTPMSSIVSAKAIQNNPSILRGQNAGHVRAWAQRAMDTRWPKLGSKDWVHIWFNPREAAAYTGAPATVDPEDEVPIKEEEDDVEEQAPAPPPARPALPGVRGDPDIWLVQSMLRSMNYPPGSLDGLWGGMTAEAIAGFINDRNGSVEVEIAPPKSMEEFLSVKDALKAELTKASSEGFRRPVAPERQNPTTKKVDEVAPEAAPVRRNSQVGFWGSIGAMIAAAWNAVSGSISDIWSFFTDNEDKVPDAVKDPNWIWAHLAAVPTSVWFLAIAGVLGFVWLNSKSAVGKIVDDIKTGVRK